MTISPSVKQMVHAAQEKFAHIENPLERKRAEILAQQAEMPEVAYPSIRAQLALLGFRKATKRELQQIIVNAMEADPDA